MKRLFKEVQAWWDWWIYRRAFHSLKRIAERKPGFALIMEMHLHDYNKRNPVSKQVKRAAVWFYESMQLEAERKGEVWRESK